MHSENSQFLESNCCSTSQNQIVESVNPFAVLKNFKQNKRNAVTTEYLKFKKFEKKKLLKFSLRKKENFENMKYFQFNNIRDQTKAEVEH